MQQLDQGAEAQIAEKEQQQATAVVAPEQKEPQPALVVAGTEEKEPQQALVLREQGC